MSETLLQECSFLNIKFNHTASRTSSITKITMPWCMLACICISPHTHTASQRVSCLLCRYCRTCHVTILYYIVYTILWYTGILYYIVQILIVALKGPFKGPPPPNPMRTSRAPVLPSFLQKNGLRGRSKCFFRTKDMKSQRSRPWAVQGLGFLFF